MLKPVACLLSLVVAATVTTSLERGSSDAEIFDRESLGCRQDQSLEQCVIEEIGEGALVIAARAGEIELVRGLLEAGLAADPTAAGGESALEVAVLGGHSALIELLLARGADPNRRTSRRLSLLELAFRQPGRAALGRRLVAAGATVESSLLARALSTGEEEWIELLLAAGATIDSEQARGLLSGAMAPRSGDPPTVAAVRRLLALGADPNVRLASGLTPLHQAVGQRLLPVARLLAEAGAEIEAVEPRFGKTSLHLAAELGELSLVELLLELGADPAVRAENGATPLILAVQTRSDDVARRLLARGVPASGAVADPHLGLRVASGAALPQLVDGRDALLELAARQWLPESAASTVDLLGRLVEAGAVLDRHDGEGRGALDLAADGCALDLLVELIRLGASVPRATWVDLHDPWCQAPPSDWHPRLEAAALARGLELPSWVELREGELAPLSQRDVAAQRRTVADVRNVGTALMAWLTDHVQAAAAGRAAVTAIGPVSPSELRLLLVPRYMRTLPERDGWGHRYEYRMAADLFGPPPVMVVRSPGRDGRFDGDDYPTTRVRRGEYRPREADRDVVWIDGYYIQAPALPARE